jgi:selenide,water dikinase
LSPDALAHVLRPLQEMFDPSAFPNLLMGLNTPDDAAVYRLDDGQVVILTTDFFTPLVDDPFDYGAIAAANALSDVYAMGGRPVVALNLIAFPADRTDQLTEVLRGMGETVRAAGCAIAGGHSIQDREPKVGLCVMGLGQAPSLLTKGGAKPGDVIVLTKPLGTGVISTAIKAGRADPAHVRGAVDSMKQLNRAASEAAIAQGVRAGTDITGFGLVGHLWELAEASNVALELNLGAVPFLEGAQRYADEWLIPGGTFSNRDYYRECVSFQDDMCDGDCMLLFDAQTSGGLALAVPADQLDSFRRELARVEQPNWVIGVVREGAPHIRVF